MQLDKEMENKEVIESVSMSFKDSLTYQAYLGLKMQIFTLEELVELLENYSEPIVEDPRSKYLGLIEESCLQMIEKLDKIVDKFSSDH